LRDGASLFRGLAARSSNMAQLTRKDGADRAKVELVSGNFFSVLGVQPRLGRLLAREDERIRNGSPAVVLSYAYWAKQFGSSEAVVGKTVRLNDLPFVIVGVAPETFHGFMNEDEPALYMAITMRDTLSPGAGWLDSSGSQWLNILGRMKPGVTAEQAQASLRPLWSATLRRHLDEMKVRNESARKRLLAKNLALRPAAQGINQLEGAWRKPLTALLAMVGLLLLIACANVANLLVARAVMRNREIAVRLAIGASRWQVARQSLAESLLLAAAGGTIGTAVSFGLIRGLLVVLPEGMAGTALSAKPDFVVLGFSLLLVLLTTLLFGVLPAMQSTRVDPMPALRDQSATASASGLQTRWRQGLVIGQIGLSLALLVGSGLFAKTLLNLLSHDPGFVPERLLTFYIDPRLSGYSVERGLALYRALLERLGHAPNVESVALAEISPLSNSESSSNITVEGFSANTDENSNTDRNAVGPSYFKTMKSPLVSGREFSPRDLVHSAKVAVVSEAFARRFLAGKNAVGKRMALGGGGSGLDIEIVGVAKDANNLSLRDAPKPMLYMPLEQSYASAKQIRAAAFLVRSRGEGTDMERSARAIVRQVDANLPVFGVRTMVERVNESIYTDRLSAMLATAFGVLAMLLAAVGLYGVVAYSVARRTVEIGIRLALGALPGQVVKLVMQEVALLAGAGVLVGLPAAYALGRLMSAQLYGVKAESADVVCGATAVILLAAAVAGFVPAYRASGVDPKTALRYE
ncbi:MAG TPA: ABC transporter permease, partial [Bryobacteraceae bacterium]|nr:ABC transporter permease [Bryobacteraceae bacterium]